MSSTRRDPLVGGIVDGRYEVLARLARGGMSTVYLALDTRLDREVALKVMHPHLAEDHVLVGRFEQEAKTAARLSHPHVVAVLDQGHTEDPSGEVLAYLVMEHVPGHTLRTVIREQAPLTPREALRHLRPLVDGLAAAHRAGLVHRDVKPENVLVRMDGRITVADFGLSRAATAHTSAGQAVVGTPAYLAPEHIAGAPADARSDVYAAGIILFELLTGRQPFTAATALQVAYRHVHERVPVPSSLQPGLPEALDDLVLWCTEPDPADRPADAGEVLDRLDAVAAELGPAELDRPPVRVPDAVEGRPGPEHDETTTLDALDPHDPHDPLHDGDGDETTALDAGDHHATRVLPSLPADALPTEALAADDVVRRSPGPAPEAPLTADAAEAPAPSARRSRRAARREARRPALDLGRGTGRAAAIGAAVTLLLTGVALLLGWTLGSGGLGVGATAVVPELDGLAREAAEERLVAAGLATAVTARHDELRTEGTVVATSPQAGQQVDRGTPVEVTVSAGPAPVPVPDLAGVSVRHAHGVARDARFAVEVDARRTDPHVPAGAVLEQRPAAGERATPGTVVRVVLSEGRAVRAVPDVTGLSLAAARTSLQDDGWDVREHRVPVPLPAGDAARVLHQSPAAGTPLLEGTRVELWSR